MEPVDQVAELRELLTLIGEIISVADGGRGCDDGSNAALKTIKERAHRLEVVVRALEETSLFNTAEILAILKQTIRS